MVCTYTNVALDNLVDGFVNAQVKPLRIGHQQSVRSDLLEHSLDAQLAKHSLSKDLLEILEEENSMSVKMDELIKKEEEMAKKMEKYTDSDRQPRKDVIARLNKIRSTIMKLSMRQKVWNNKKYIVQQRMLRSILNASDVVSVLFQGTTLYLKTANHSFELPDLHDLFNSGMPCLGGDRLPSSIY